MPNDKPDNLDSKFDQLITHLNADQADALTLELAAAYTAGKHSVRETRLSSVQKQAIKRLSAEHFGYISEFNAHLGEQLKDKARGLLGQNKGYADIRKEILDYTDAIFDGSEQVVIDRTGQTRKVIEVTKTGKLKEVDKVITKPYVTNTQAYADMLSQTAIHAAFEEGRASEYQRMGFKKWRYISVCDERSRPDHCALTGRVFEYGTTESDMALQLMHSPNCRCRSVAYFNDPSLDTRESFYDEQKKNAGLRYDDDKQKWVFGD